jgi:hypothetical protein
MTVIESSRVLALVRFRSDGDLVATLESLGRGARD